MQGTLPGRDGQLKSQLSPFLLHADTISEGKKKKDDSCGMFSRHIEGYYVILELNERRKIRFEFR